MLSVARLRYIVGKTWGTERYLNMKTFGDLGRRKTLADRAANCTKNLDVTLRSQIPQSIDPSPQGERITHGTMRLDFSFFDTIHRNSKKTPEKYPFRRWGEGCPCFFCVLLFLFYIIIRKKGVSYGWFAFDYMHC